MSVCRHVVVMLMWLWLLFEPCTCHISVEELLFYLLPGWGCAGSAGWRACRHFRPRAKQSKDRETETERARERERERRRNMYSYIQAQSKIDSALHSLKSRSIAFRSSLPLRLCPRWWPLSLGAPPPIRFSLGFRVLQ